MTTRVVVSGLAGQMPLAGVALHYLQYCLGFRDLGVEVLYLEDGHCWPYHPRTQNYEEDPTYTVEWLRELFGSVGLRWAFQDGSGRYHGSTEEEVLDHLDGADLLLNVSGGIMPEQHHRRAKLLAMVDTDPAVSQVAALQGSPRHQRLQSSHDLYFTFAERMHADVCRIPDAGKQWITTRQPVHLPLWEADPGRPDQPGAVYTTVMNWSAHGGYEWDGEPWGDKAAEFGVIRALPRRTGLWFELAVAGGAPTEELRAEGWEIIDPRPPTRTFWTFREYLRASRGEVGVCKQAYVRSHSGWFSERSANYLAAGRPVVTQDTGWSHLLPTGKGLFAFSSIEEAEAGLQAIEDDPVAHGQAARRLAAEHFDARDVLTRLLSDAGVT
jgi:hypothetical protein